MTGNGRGTMRPQGRTPPFLLIGLLVVLCIIGFSYWNVSSRSNEQASKIGILQDEIRIMSARKLEAEKQSESSRSSLRNLEKEKSDMESRIRQTENSLQEANSRAKNAEDELQSIKNELEGKKESLNKCEQDSNGIQQELQKIKEESENLKQDVANKPATCDQNACEEPIKNILNILVNSLGRQQIISTLQNNNIQDIGKLISADAGVQAGQQPAANQANPQQPGVNPQQPAGNVVNQQQPGLNPGDLQQLGVKPADQQQPGANPIDPQKPAVNPAEQVPGQPGVGQVQPPKDAASPGQPNVVRMVGNGSNTTTTTTTTTPSESSNTTGAKPATNDSSNMHGEGNREVPGNKGGEGSGKDRITKDSDKNSQADKNKEGEIPVTTSTGKMGTEVNTSATSTTQSTKKGKTTENGKEGEADRKAEGAAANKNEEDDGEGEGEEEEEEIEEGKEDKPLKFEPNKLPLQDVAKDDDAIDRMHENMALNERKPILP